MKGLLVYHIVVPLDPIVALGELVGVGVKGDTSSRLYVFHDS